MGALDAPPSPDASLCPVRTPGSSFPPAPASLRLQLPSWPLPSGSSFPLAPRPTERCPWSLLLRLVLGLLLLEVPGAGLAPLHAGRGRRHLSWLQPGGDGARERGLPLSPPLAALPRGHRQEGAPHPVKPQRHKEGAGAGGRGLRAEWGWGGPAPSGLRVAVSWSPRPGPLTPPGAWSGAGHGCDVPGGFCLAPVLGDSCVRCPGSKPSVTRSPAPHSQQETRA